MRNRLLSTVCCLVTAGTVFAQDRSPDTKQRVFVPVEELDAILQGDTQGVILPRAEFERLVAAADNQTDAPAKIVVSRVDYTATPRESRLAITAAVHFRQFKPGWQVLSLRTTGLAIESASIGNEKAALGRTRPDQVQLLHNKPGEHVLDLTLSTPLASVGSDQVSAFSLIDCPSATLNFEVPAGRQLALNGLLLERSAPTDQPASLSVPVGGQPKVELRVTERQRSRSSSALVFMSSAYGINVAPSEITWQAVTTLQSFGEPVDNFTFSVPNTLEIAAVSSTGLESWTLNDSADGQQTEITLTYRQPIDGTRKVTFRGVMAVPVNEQWALPGLRLPSAASEVARAVVRHPVGTRLVIENMAGVRRTTDASAQQQLSQASFDIWQRDFDLSLRLQLREREVLANLSTVLDVEENAVRLETLAGIECLNAPLFEAIASVPSGWEVDAVMLDNQLVQWQRVARDADRTTLRIPFPQPLQPGGEKKLKIQATRNLVPDDVEMTSFEMPQVRVEDAGVVEGVVLVRSADWLRTTPRDITGLDAAVLPGVSGDHLGFRYQDGVFSGTIEARPRKTRLAAWTQTYTRLDPDKAMTWLDLHLNVGGGGLRELTVRLPESVGENLRFAITRNCTPPARIREQVATTVADAERTWVIRFDRRVRGVLSLGVPLEQPRTDNGNSVVEANVSDADRQYGYIAVEASAEQHLELNSDQQTALQSVDPIELPPSGYVPKERIVAAYRYVQPGFGLTITEDRFDREAVPTAVCHALDIESVMGEAGEIRHRATAHFVAVGIQNLRLQLPGGTKLWSTEIDDQPVEVRRDGDAFLIPLRNAARPDAPRTLKLSYAGTIDRLALFGRFRQSTPRLSVDVGNGTQPIETLERSWDLYHPAGTLFTNSHGRFEPEDSLGRAGLLARLPGMVSIPRGNTARDKFMAVGAVLLVVLIPALCYRRWGWTGLAGSAVLAGMLMLFVVAAMFEQYETADRVAAMKTQAGTATPMAASADDYAYDFDTESAGEVISSGMGQPELARRPARAMNRTTPEEKAEGGDGAIGFGAPPTEQAANEAPQIEPADELTVQAATPAMPAEPGARLSVPVTLQIPDSAVTTRFLYSGTGTGEGTDLDLSYHDHELSSVARIAFAVFVVLAMWWFRSGSLGLRVVVVCVGLMVPAGITPLVPAAWQVVLEGVFFGTLAGSGLWCVRALRNLPKARSTTATAAVVLACLVGSSVTAQDKPADQRIIVPYSAEGLPGAAKRVFLPQAEFLKLWNRANPDKAAANAPYPGLVSSATYAAQLAGTGENASVRIRGRYVIHSFRDEQIRIPLPLGNVGVEKAELNGQSAPLQAEHVTVKLPGDMAQQQQQRIKQPKPQTRTVESQYLTIVVDEPGTHILDVDFVVPAKTTGPAGRFELPLRPVGSALMSFRMPGEDLQLRVNGSSTAWRAGAEGTIEFPVSRGGTVSVEWQPRDEDSGVDRVVHSEVTTAALFDDSGLHTKSKLQYRVRQGTLSEVTFRIPAGSILQNVSGPDVGGWQQDEQGDNRTIRVFFRRSVDTETAVLVELFDTPDITDTPTSVSIPLVEPTEVTRETGQLGVFVTRAINIRPGTVVGGTQIRGDAFPLASEFKLGKRLPGIAWRYPIRPFSVSINASRPTAQLTAKATHAVFIERHKSRYTSRFELQPAGAPRARLALLLPAGFLPLEVHATNISDWYPHTDASGTELLIVDLRQPTLQPVELVVTGTIAREADAATVALPVPRMNNVTEASAEIGIRIDESYTSSIGNVGNWKSVAPEVLDADIQNLTNTPIRFAFTTDEDAPAPIEVQLTQVPPTLFGESVSVINMTDASVEYSLNLKWIVRQSATDRFAFSGPDWLAGKVEFQADGLRQVIESDPADGRVTWTLVLQESRSDQYFAMGLATFPAVVNDQLRTPDLRIEPGSPGAGAIRVQNHYAVVVNQSQRLITPVGVQTSARQADMQIQIPVNYLNRATDIVSVPENSPAVWNVTTPERREAAPALVNLADLTTVLAADGSFRTRAVYSIRNRSRQFLPVVLPDDTSLLSVFVGDSPSRPVVTDLNGKRTHLIALPRTSETDLSFDVVVVLAGSIDVSQLSSAFNPGGTDISLPRPEIVTRADDAEFGIPVSMSVWKVHVPRSWHATTVRQSGQTNMTEQDDEGSDVIRMLSSLKDAVDQSVTFNRDDNYSGKVQSRLRAYDNFSAIEKELTSQTLSRNDEVGQQLDVLRSNLAELRQQLEREGVQFESGQAVAPTQREMPRNGEAEGEMEQQEFIADFNDAIIGSNSVRYESRTQQLENNFKLGLKNAAAPRSAATRPAKPGNSAFRNRSGSKSLGNLDAQIKGGANQQQRDLGGALPGQSGQAGAAGARRGSRAGGGFGGGGGGFGGFAADGQVPQFQAQGQATGLFDPRSGRAVEQHMIDDLAITRNDLPGADPAGPGTFQSFDEEQDASGQATVTEWTRVGGLSLPIDITGDSVPLNFSKVGGQPGLTLRIRPADTMRKGYGAVWALVWVGLAIAAVIAFLRHGLRGVCRFVPAAFTIIGLLGFVLLGGQAATFAFVLFVVGTLGLGLVYCSTPQAEAA